MSEPAERVTARRIPLAAGRASALLLTLDRPDALNAMDGAMLAALDARLDEVGPGGEIRVVLITGAGRAFSAGGDMKAYVELQRDPVAFPRFVAQVHEVFGRLRRLPVPVVALVNGVTAAGGLELLLGCDFAIAARSARIGDGHLNFGQMGGGGVLTLLPRIVGLPRATELVLSGEFLTAEGAAEIKLISRVVDDEDLLAEGLRFAESVATKSPLAVRNAKQVMASLWAENGSLDAGLAHEHSVNCYYCLTSEDAREGLAAFGEKRPPRFTGR